MSFALAGLGFAAFLLSDFASVGWLKNRVFRYGFAVGAALWAAAAAMMLAAHAKEAAPARLILFGIFALAALCAEAYALFFALPFEKTYVRPEKERTVCCEGLYGLCRHPAFWPFAGFCGCLFLMIPCGESLALALLLAALDFAYIAVQDAWIFDRTFADYAGYKKRTPFLIPGAAQWRLFWNGKASREGKA